MTSLRFAVIGAGRLGASLALALRDQGLTLLGFTALTSAGRERAKQWLGSSVSSGLSELVSLRPDLYLIAVPDTELPKVASELGNLLVPRPGVFVAHTSGATSVKVLGPCVKRGAAAFVFHPLQTFSDPAVGRGSFAGAAVAITPCTEGRESPAAALGFGLARLLNARPFLLSDDKRALYHCAAAIACNYFVTLEHQAREAFVRSGLPSDDALSLFLPLVRTTLENIQTQGTIKALTGPLSRGDTGTVRKHIDALSQNAPEMLPLYRALGLATLPILRARQEIETASITALEALLTSSD